MRLYLIRHGIAAESARFEGEDLERPLTARGRKRCAQAARGLRALGVAPQWIYCSQARRSLETAQILRRRLGGELRSDARINPGADFASLAQLLQELPADLTSIALVGHEPDLSDMASGLLHSDAAARSFLHIDFRKSSCMELQLFSAESGELRSFLPARLLRKLART